MVGTSIMNKLTDTSVLPLALFLWYFYITVIGKEVEIVGTNKIKVNIKHRLNQKFNNTIHNEIIQNKWLSDESINLAQTILFKNSPLISGFEDTTLCLLNMFSVQTGEFVQVLHADWKSNITQSLRRLKEQHLWCISTIHYRTKI